MKVSAWQQVSVMGGHSQRLGQILEHLVQEDQTGSVGLQQLGELGRGGPPELVVLVGDLGEGSRATEAVGELAKQRGTSASLISRSGSPAANAPPSSTTTVASGSWCARALDSSLTKAVPATSGGVPEQVVGREQRVGLAPAEFGLESVDAGGCHVARSRAVSSPRKAARFSVR